MENPVENTYHPMAANRAPGTWLKRVAFLLGTKRKRTTKKLAKTPRAIIFFRPIIAPVITPRIGT